MRQLANYSFGKGSIFDGDTWPSVEVVSICVAADAIDFGWGKHTIGGPLTLTREYFSMDENIESSAFRELFGGHSLPPIVGRVVSGKIVWGRH